jgi:hypothetical protein
MTLVIIALVCSQLSTPDRANCLIDTALRHERLELVATNDTMCELNGMIAAAAVMNIDPKFEYLKVMCVRPSIEINRLPG